MADIWRDFKEKKQIILPPMVLYYKFNYYCEKAITYWPTKEDDMSGIVPEIYPQGVFYIKDVLEGTYNGISAVKVQNENGDMLFFIEGPLNAVTKEAIQNVKVPSLEVISDTSNGANKLIFNWIFHHAAEEHKKRIVEKNSRNKLLAEKYNEELEQRRVAFEKEQLVKAKEEEERRKKNTLVHSGKEYRARNWTGMVDELRLKYNEKKSEVILKSPERVLSAECPGDFIFGEDTTAWKAFVWDWIEKRQSKGFIVNELLQWIEEAGGLPYLYEDIDRYQIYITLLNFLLSLEQNKILVLKDRKTPMNEEYTIGER